MFFTPRNPFYGCYINPTMKGYSLQTALSHKHKSPQCLTFGHPFKYPLILVRKAFKGKLLIHIIYKIIRFLKGFIKINLELFLTKFYDLHAKCTTYFSI